jgi:hypothetical protein
MQLLEKYSFNGHVTSSEAKKLYVLNGNTKLYESAQQIHRRHMSDQKLQLAEREQ